MNLARPKSVILGEKSEIRDPESDPLRGFGFWVLRFRFEMMCFGSLHQDVRGLKVAVYHSSIVRMLNRLGQGGDQLRRLARGHGPIGSP